MKVTFAGAEAAPFVKTGGLGDVLGSLADAVAARGNEVHLFLPAYRTILEHLPAGVSSTTVNVPGVHGDVETRILHAFARPQRAAVHLVDAPQYFDRVGLYLDEHGHDFGDNSDRFAFFGRAVLSAVMQMRLEPDVIHAHDWQAGLIPAYLRSPKWWPLAKVGSVFTIHNLAFQGNFDFRDWPGVMLDPSLRSVDGLEFYGRFSHLKAGVQFADEITTVSPTYAREVLQPEFGHGMDGLLRSRADRLTGILNGIDAEVWNPARDPHLPMGYTLENVADGKRVAKAEFYRQSQLEDLERPLVAMVGRLTMQKGFDLFAAIAEQLISRGANLAVLTTPGSYELELPLWNVAQRFPGRVALFLGFNEPLAHLLYAAADVLTAPSRFEPCGLTQMMAMRYGTPPVVRAVGGLADTVVDANPSSIALGTANGFVFQQATPGSLNVSVQRALYAFEKSDLWNRLIAAGMSADYSWSPIAGEYEETYRRALARRR